MTIKTVVFDFGGVLFDWNPRYLYGKVFETKERTEDFLTRVCPFSWHEQLDLGKPFAEACAERKALFPEFSREIDMYNDRWDEMFHAPFVKTHAILKALAKNYPVYGLTNWPWEKLSVFMEKPENKAVFSAMRGIVCSAREKIAKPDAGIYEILLNRYALNASETVFIDDNVKNVAAAEKTGMTGVKYESPDRLSGALREKGLVF